METQTIHALEYMVDAMVGIWKTSIASIFSEKEGIRASARTRMKEEVMEV